MTTGDENYSAVLLGRSKRPFLTKRSNFICYWYLRGYPFPRIRQAGPITNCHSCTEWKLDAAFQPDFTKAKLNPEMKLLIVNWIHFQSIFRAPNIIICTVHLGRYIEHISWIVTWVQKSTAHCKEILIFLRNSYKEIDIPCKAGKSVCDNKFPIKSEGKVNCESGLYCLVWKLAFLLPSAC